MNRACPDPQPNGLTPTDAPESQWPWAVVAAICLGVAISLNIVAASILVLFVFALRWRAVVLALSVAIPLMLSSPFGYPNLRSWSSLGQVMHLSRFNDLFWWILEDTVWPNPHQRTFHYFPIMIVCVIVGSLFFIRNWKRGTLWPLGTVLLLSPIMHPKKAITKSRSAKSRLLRARPAKRCAS